MPESEVFTEVEAITQGGIIRGYAEGVVHYVCTGNRVYWAGEHETFKGLVVFREVLARKGVSSSSYCLRGEASRHSLSLQAGYDLAFWAVPTKMPLKPGRIVGLARATRTTEPVAVAAALREHFALTSRHAHRS